MRFTSSAIAALLLVATSSPLVHSFVQTTKPNDIGLRTTGNGPNALFLTPEDLTNYMAKAHEEKIRAIEDVETKKNAEIHTLKDEVKALKESIPKESAVVVSTPPASGIDLSSMTKDELRAKLVSYQNFMAEYIVKAQQQKLLAVQAAELATATKYEAKIKLLLGAAPSTDTASTTTTAVEAVSSSAATKLYDTRSAHVAAAAKAGKSRWGDKEVAKVKIGSTTDSSVVEVEAAVEKPNGASASASAAVPTQVKLPGSSLYEERNEKVVAAGKAGKSRWGDAEVKKAAEEPTKQASLSSAPATPPPTAAAVDVSNTAIEAADHGLRKDGGVGGPSLAERVNLGQQLFTGSEDAAAAVPAVVSAAPSTFDLRNAKIAAAAAAGKSRWGSMENDKATILAAAASKVLASSNGAAGTSQQEIVSSPEIEAADHGLRSDGGVGGPSLAERVNLGLGIV
mmetsp:Transcript_26992/g.59347  ORF Transcript_26992/g.59347 Transcript_26992/m.59347 type:complete len:454 (+) Transcript_26992:455-1816(+)